MLSFFECIISIHLPMTGIQYFNVYHQTIIGVLAKTVLLGF